MHASSSHKITQGVGFHGVGIYIGHNTVENAPHAGMTGAGNDLLFEFNVIRRTGICVSDWE